MNVLIGGTGFLGGAVAEEMVKRQMLRKQRQDKLFFGFRLK